MLEENSIPHLPTSQPRRDKVEGRLRTLVPRQSVVPSTIFVVKGVSTGKEATCYN